jgi:hypothetical protein
MQADAERNIHTLRMAGKHVTGELTAIVKALLGKATRERMLQWLGEVIEGNNERAKMQANIMVRGGFMLLMVPASCSSEKMSGQRHQWNNSVSCSRQHMPTP